MPTPSTRAGRRGDARTEDVSRPSRACGCGWTSTPRPSGAATGAAATDTRLSVAPAFSIASSQGFSCERLAGSADLLDVERHDQATGDQVRAKRSLSRVRCSVPGESWSVLRASRREGTAIMAGPRSAVVVALASLLLPWLVLHASAKPITTMTHGPKGNVEFQTLTLSASDFWNGVKTGPPITISGELLLPKGDARVPAIVLSHGGGGIGGMEDTWARELRSLGVAVFLVDSFTGRHIRSFPPENELSRAGQVYDVYQALALLATHPRVDPGRIALMGGSRGGGLSIMAAMTRSLKAQAPENLEFCAYLALYPTIRSTVDYGQLASRPIRLFMGTLDEATPITTVRGFAEKQRTAGADVKLFEYEGAHHAFDNPGFRAPLVATIGKTLFTVLYHPQAHAKVMKDVKETLAEVFAKP